MPLNIDGAWRCTAANMSCAVLARALAPFSTRGDAIGDASGDGATTAPDRVGVDTAVRDEAKGGGVGDCRTLCAPAPPTPVAGVSAGRFEAVAVGWTDVDADAGAAEVDAGAADLATY